jgi:uncharacterized 2Fe-2S/4Fe-4S cluster protein (DUF4445 family)
MKTFNLLFAPTLKEVVVDEGKTILDGAREIGVFVDSQCNGKGKCGKCRVRIVEGSTSPFTSEEGQFISQADKLQGYRLACMARVVDNVTVLVPEENLLSPEAAKKVFTKRTAVVNPAVKAFVVDLPTAGRDEAPQPYFDRICFDLEHRQGLQNLTMDISTLRTLAPTVKEAKNKATVFVWMDREIIAVRPGDDDTCLGLALDIGTTTVALYLCDLRNGEVIASASTTNPQVLFGTDVMSRISYSSHNPDQGVKRMQRELVRSINTLVDQMTARNGFRADQILDVTVVGNTVMHHIFLGIAPDHLGLWPFSPTVQNSVDVKAKEVGIGACSAAYVHVLPVEAGFVGADNVAVLISEEPYNHNEIALIIDLGTNGEIVLGNKDRLVSCSCATGPALEGAHIVSGMRATKGAIERVRIDPATYEADYSVVGTEGWASEHPRGTLRPVGICGSGIIDTVAHLFKTGLIGAEGAFSQNIQTPRLRIGSSGVREFVLVWKDETGMAADIVLTQKDIRQIQLAKGALHGGCRVLMKHLGINAVPKMIIAGAFGMHIDKENSLILGLFPSVELSQMFMVGNSAGHGAYLALVDRGKRQEANRIAREVEHIELALEKGFHGEFVRALSIPYKE